MELRLWTVDADDGVEELHHLLMAVVEDDKLRCAGKELETSRAGAGELGGEEYLRLVLDSTALLGALSSCVTAWIAMRKPRLTLVVKGPGGEARVTAGGGIAVGEAEVLQALKIARGALGEAS